MASLSDLISQKEALDRQIREAQLSAKADAITQVRKLMSEHGLTTADLVAQGKHGVRQGSKVAPKYRDSATGATWTGRGLKPKWLTAAIEAGKTSDEFLI